MHWGKAWFCRWGNQISSVSKAQENLGRRSGIFKGQISEQNVAIAKEAQEEFWLLIFRFRHVRCKHSWWNSQRCGSCSKEKARGQRCVEQRVLFTKRQNKRCVFWSTHRIHWCGNSTSIVFSFSVHPSLMHAVINLAAVRFLPDSITVTVTICQSFAVLLIGSLCSLVQERLLAVPSCIEWLTRHQQLCAHVILSWCAGALALTIKPWNAPIHLRSNWISNLKRCAHTGVVRSATTP